MITLRKHVQRKGGHPMKKRLCSLLLCLAVLLTLLPAAALASDDAVQTPPREDATYGASIWVSGIELFPGQHLANYTNTPGQKEPTTPGYAYWDGSTLTLNNYDSHNYTYAYSSSTACIYRSGSYTIKLIGQNFLSNDDSDSDAVACVNGMLVISGPGSLSVWADYGIWVDDMVDNGTGDLVLTGAKVQVNANATGITAVDVTGANSFLNINAGNYGILATWMELGRSTVSIDTDRYAIRCSEKLIIRSPMQVISPSGAAVAPLGGHQYIADRNGNICSTALIATPFTDVKTGSFYEQAVYFALGQGITTGTGGTNFSPNNTCSRAEAVTFIHRYCGNIEPVLPRLPFQDINTNAFYHDALRFCVQSGITTGTSATTFSPNAPCTRAQIITFLWRAHGEPEPLAGACVFKDIQVNSFYYDAMMWAVQNDITTGTSATTFSPNAPCTRAQMVTLLYRLHNLYNS